MKRKTTTVLAVFGLTLLASLPPVFGCSCVLPSPPCVALEYADAVFVGRIVEISPIESEGAGSGVIRPINLFRRVRVTFALEYPFQGPETETIEVVTPYWDAMCGLGQLMGVGDAWLIYAYRRDEELETHLCTLSRRLRPDYDIDAIIAYVYSCENASI